MWWLTIFKPFREMQVSLSCAWQYEIAVLA